MKTKSKMTVGILCAILAAALYAISTPVSKVLLKEIPPLMMAALLYLGAGIGMVIAGFVRKKTKVTHTEPHLEKCDLPFAVGIVILDIAAPIFLMLGLTLTTAANASLLNNFEIVATSIIALMVFKEAITKRLWIAIGLITLSSVIVSVEDSSSFSFSFGSVFVLLACVCWGLENNCTRMLSQKDPLEIVIFKGFGSGMGSLLLAFLMRETVSKIEYIVAALLLGFLAYGLSIFFYVYAQRELGAAKTSTYYALAPFGSVVISLIIFQELPTVSFLIALGMMMVGAYFASTDSI